MPLSMCPAREEASRRERLSGPAAPVIRTCLFRSRNEPEFANRHSNALFVSVHFQQEQHRRRLRIETHCLAPRGVPSMDEENLSHRRLAYSTRDTSKIPPTWQLATTIHAALVRNLRPPDRGVKRARSPSAWSKHHHSRHSSSRGFMSGTPDAQLIASCGSIANASPVHPRRRSIATRTLREANQSQPRRPPPWFDAATDPTTASCKSWRRSLPLFRA